MKIPRIFMQRTTEINIKVTETMSIDDLHNYYRERIRYYESVEGSKDVSYDQMEMAYHKARYYETLDNALYEQIPTTKQLTLSGVM